MTRHRSLLLAAGLALFLAGCGFKPSAPPVEVVYRDSLLGQGLIVQVKNTSNEVLSEVRVEIRSPDREFRSFTESTVEPYGLLEVGWKRLGGWEIPGGSRVTVRAKGYLLSARAEIPED